MVTRQMGKVRRGTPTILTPLTTLMINVSNGMIKLMAMPAGGNRERETR